MLSKQPLKQNFADLREREKRNRKLSARVLYNAADEPRGFMHDGVPYVIPPNGPSEQRFAVRENISEPGLVEDKGAHAIYDGTLRVFDRYGIEGKKARDYAKAKRKDPSLEKPHADKLLAGSMDIAEFAQRKVGPSGVVMLTGDPVEDKALRAMAQEVWNSFKRSQVERILRNYHQRTEAFRANPMNRGQYAPPMDDVERAAQRWSDEDAAGAKSTKAFVCPDNCGFDDDDQKVMDLHVQVRHPRIWAEHVAEQEAKPAPAKSKAKTEKDAA